MKLTYYGHSCFLLESRGYTVVMDPFKGVQGRADTNLTADGVYCSHEHFDHNYTQGVKIKKGGINPFTITEIHTFHDDVKGAKRGENIIRIFESEGYKLAHFGDLGCRLEEDQLRLLAGLDVALIPVGGTYTIDPEEAKRLIEAIKPVTAVPMHYRKGEEGFPELKTLSDFTDLFENVKEVSGTLDLNEKPSGITTLFAVNLNC